MERGIRLLPVVALLLVFGCKDLNDSGDIGDERLILHTGVVPENGGEIIPNGGEFDGEEEVELRAMASEGFIFTEWSGDLNGNSNPHVLKMDKDFQAVAIFTEKKYTLDVEVEGNGHVYEELAEDPAKASYEEGTKVRLTADPTDGWVFSHWEGDLSGDDNPKTLTIEEEMSVKAVFTESKDDDKSGEGDSNPDDDKGENDQSDDKKEDDNGNDDSGDDKNSEDDDKSDDDDKSGDDKNGDDSKDDDKSDDDGKEDKGDDNNSEDDDKSGDDKKGDDDDKNGDDKDDGKSGDDKKDDDKDDGKSGDDKKGDDDDKNGDDKDDGKSGDDKKDDDDKGDSGVDGDDSKDDSKDDEPKPFTLDRNITGKGTVWWEPHSETEKIPEGTKLTIGANPSNGWEFSHWEGDFQGSENPIEDVKINRDKVFTAVFEKKEEEPDPEPEIYSITTSVDHGEGEIIVDPEQDEYEEGTIINKVEAVPADGWTFVRWEGDFQGDENPVEDFEIDQNKEIKALFEQEPETFTVTVEDISDGEVELTPDKEEYESGEEVTAEFIPDEEREFVMWIDDLSDYIDENPLTFTVERDMNINAYIEVKRYQATIESSPGGGLIVNPHSKYGGYTRGQEVYITASPMNGYEFVEWSHDLFEYGSENRITIQFDPDEVWGAVFEEKEQVGS
ncbi:MAG: hypothetical protein WD317_05665 [Balneolaceae bacterium]